MDVIAVASSSARRRTRCGSVSPTVSATGSDLCTAASTLRPKLSFPALAFLPTASYRDARKPRDEPGTVPLHVRRTLPLKRRSG